MCPRSLVQHQYYSVGLAMKGWLGWSCGPAALMLLAKGAHSVQLQPSDTDELWMYETFTEKVWGAV